MLPIDYSINVQSPFEASLQGYQAGAAIRNDQQQQQAQQAAIAQQEAMRRLYSDTAANPTAENYARLMLADPKASEAIKRSWEVQSAQQQQAMTSDLLQWGAALKSGRPEIVANQLEQRAAAIEGANGGQPSQESQTWRSWAMAAKADPQYALGLIQAKLSASPLGKDAAETLGKFGAEQRAQDQAPGALRKVNADAAAAEADAATKQVTAKYAEPAALKELELKGWNVENIKSEIGYRREQSRISAMQVALAQKKDAREARELELKIQEAQTKLGDAARAKVADLESATSSIDNFLNTADRFLNAGTETVSKDGKTIRRPNSTLRAATGPIDSRLPTVQQDVADIEALAETLGSQAFLSQIPSMKGLGALSNAEGEKLQSALTNLSMKQSAPQLIANVQEAQRLILKARQNVQTRYGIKAPPPDTPAAQSTSSEIDALVKKYGG